jgi:cyclic-di-GMP-binding biofilm dispersal mediator protein
VSALAGRVVAVVGASGGLGAPLAAAFAQRGAQVVVAGRNPARLAAAGPPGAPQAVVDIRDPDAGDTVVSVARSAYGRLDGVVNATGIVAFGDLAATADLTVEELFLTNTLGPLWLLRRVFPALAETQGFAVMISGVIAEQPLPGMAAYGASKAALAAAVVAAGREFRRAKVRLIDARPPHTETGLASRAVEGTAPRFRPGLDPASVATVIIDAIEAGETDLPSSRFGAAAETEPGR